ncbi:MAG: BON domain-containing protein [Holosporaceae bacterium]|jgi:osmotically-inducible protein OsmY|nr:BON domain-containing protein [Holosporaceae bacterium]
MQLPHWCFLLSLLLCSACDPVTWIIGGGAVAGTTAIRNQEGISGSLSDTELQAKINHALFEKDKDLFDRVELALKHGIVVVIGYMNDEFQREKALQIIKDIKGCNDDIYDEIKIQDMPDASDLALDSSITSRIKSSLSFDGNVHSLNFDVTTVKGIVYICGIAQSKYERDVVINHARTTSGVEKVVAYIKLNKNKSGDDK